jgi:hypothetical protein
MARWGEKMREMTRGRMTASIILTIALGILLSSMAAEKHASPAIGWGVAISLFASTCILRHLGRKPSVPCSIWNAAGKFVKSYIIAGILFLATAFLLVKSDQLHGDALDASILLLLGAMQLMAYAIYKLAYKGPDSWRRNREPKTVSPVVTRPTWSLPSASPRADNLIQQLCRKTGWGLLGQEAGRYQVRSRGTHSPVSIEVCYSERQVNVLFQAWFPIRFSLEKRPSGLFARVLLRNHPLHWSSWQMSIGGSCEACLYLIASVPRTALDAGLFQEVCTEIANELRDFHQELHDKFLYDLGGVMPESMPRDVQVELPVRRNWYLPRMLGGG